MTDFTPLQSLAGGLLIGSAAVVLMLTCGRIAGITGIISGLLPPAPARDWGWRAAFLGGAIAAPFAFRVAGVAVPAFTPVAGPVWLLAGGFIVGIGVTFGAGCTSGHGVCGLARFSPRSAVAVATFMAVTAATVFVARHVIGG